MGAHNSHPSRPPSSRSPSSSSSTSTFSKPPTTPRQKSWRSSLSSTSTSSSPTSPTTSPNPNQAGEEFIPNLSGRDYDVKERPRPLRVGYPYYEDVLWEAELSRRRSCVTGKEKERRRKNRVRGRLGG